jgi:plastocyanin
MADQTEPTKPAVLDNDAEDQREKAWHEWMGIAVALTGILSILAIILSLVAISSGNSGANAQAAVVGASNAAASTTPAPVVKSEAVKLMVKADDEHAKLGPNGQWHDAFLPADFAIHAGDRVTVTVVNYDSGPHTFTSPSLGVNETIPGGGSMSSPREVTFTFIAPKEPGKYQWWCAAPCDPWAMSHNGYMRGFVTVAA